MINNIPQYTQQNTVPQVHNTTPITPQSFNNMIWVQGMEGAKAYAIAPNSVIALWDSENQCIYIKMSDASGIPQPLKILDYTTRAPEPTTNTNYITEDRLNELLDEKFARLAASLQPSYQKRGGKSNVKPTVQPVE